MMKTDSMRDAFFNSVYDVAKKNRDVVIVSADMGAPSLDRFIKDLSSQFINVGIAEANMVVVAAGLALSGKKVFIYAIMPFVTSRCYEMIKVDMGFMNIPITAVGVGAGFGYVESGPTHHSTDDIAIMRALNNMTILSASDSIMAGRFARMSCEIAGPSYVRLDREMLPPIYDRKSNFDDGLACLKSGTDVCIVATGNMVHRAMEVSERLARRSIKAGVLDLYRLKPVNEKLFLQCIERSRRIVTLEEHFLIGGIGSIVAEILADNDKRVPLKRLGVQNRCYYVYGGRENIQALCGLDRGSVTETILNWIK